MNSLTLVSHLSNIFVLYSLFFAIKYNLSLFENPISRLCQANFFIEQIMKQRGYLY